MRFQEIKTSLFEVNMSPGALKAAVRDIKDAKAGIEFEMYVPAETLRSDVDYTPDYSMNTVPTSISEIISFFGHLDGGHPNSVGTLRAVRSYLTNEYNDAFQGLFGDDWERYGLKYIQQIVDEDEPDAPQEERTELALEAWHSRLNASTPRVRNIYRRAIAFYKEQEFDEEQWLSMEEKTLKDIGVEHDLHWPVYAGGDGPKHEFKAVAHKFGKAIGRPVNVSSEYHRGKRTDNAYIVEPDGSLNHPLSNTDRGLEFISPPLPIGEMLKDLRAVQDWANANGCYTNKSTGLHMNVSIPAYDDRAGLDFVKLALFLGDEYVLKSFGRELNAYAQAAMNIIRNNLEYGDAAYNALEALRKKLDMTASKYIHSNRADKYTSIHPQDSYVEFRAPGGDWLHSDPTLLANTLLRYVVCLDIACTPDKFQKEYAKKFYKLITSTGSLKSSADFLRYFSMYAAGEIDISELKGILRNNQGWRQAEKAFFKRKPVDSPPTGPISHQTTAQIMAFAANQADNGAALPADELNRLLRNASDYSTVTRNRSAEAHDAHVDSQTNLTPAQRLERMSMARLLSVRDATGQAQGVGSPTYQAYQHEFLSRRDVAIGTYGDDIGRWDQWCANQAGIPVEQLGVNR